MGFVTYVLVTGVVLGTQQRLVYTVFHASLPTASLTSHMRAHTRFTPEHLGLTASSLLAWLCAEVLVIWLCLYLLAVVSQLKWLDIIAFCGYKYIR